MTTWFSISVTVAPDAVEAIEHAFNGLESLGTEINHLKKQNLEEVTVIGYFDQLPDEAIVREEISRALRTYAFDESSVLRFEQNQVEETDWLAEWKKHWKPSQVGGFVIAPPWSDIDQSEKIVIRIEPNMAFGTGTHETTQLCLRAIERYYKPGDSMLDVGTGTGILAIATAKLNLKAGESAEIYACDTDSDSISIAKENAMMNGVGELIEFEVGSLSTETPSHTFVCANLTLDVIEPMLPMLIKNAERTLLLSGILVEQKTQLTAALERLGIRDFEIEKAGEWISVVVDS